MAAGPTRTGSGRKARERTRGATPDRRGAGGPPSEAPPREARATWYALEAEEVAAQLESSLSEGLSDDHAARRLEEVGPNELESGAGVKWWKLLFEQLRNVLILILLVAVVLSAALGHATEAIVITVIVLFAVILGFVQEYRAERAMEALGRMAAPTATLLRGGRPVEVPARELVPGDVMLLEAGDRAPADGRVFEASSLQVEEAALTGESLPVDKQVAALEARDLPVGDRVNMVYAGTTVTYGRGRAIAVATGMDTEFGGIAQLLQTVERSRTPLQLSLDRVGMTLARVAVVLVLLVVFLGVIRGQSFFEMLLFGAALAVAVVPEALPAVITISLTLAAQRMVKRNALIRRLPATETLGSVSVICSDKTGTLTKDEMTARKVFAAGSLVEVTGAGYEPEGEFQVDGQAVSPPEPVLETLRAAVLCSDARLERDEEEGWVVRGDPTEGALVVAAAKAGLRKEAVDAEFKRVDEIPFSSETKRVTTLHETPDGVVAFAKGAPEVILASCSAWVADDGEERPLDDDARETLLSAAQEMASEALRVLAVARRREATRATAEEGMTLLGLVGMIDPPRPEARDAVATCIDAGIKPIMITGDHPVTAQAIARELGILGSGRTVTGAELEDMSDEDLHRDVREIEVYARVAPAHKLRVVSAFQDNGEYVAMTGDGVNDAPALKKADIGVAMGITGTDVTKEAGAMTLTDDNFASIVAAIEEGRRVFANIKKYLMYLLAANLGEIVLLVGVSLLGWPLPLAAVQILYVNLATDGLPALALSVDPPERDIMRRPPRQHGTGIFTRPVVSLIVVGGLTSAAITFGLFWWALEQDMPLVQAMTMVFAALVLVEFFKAYAFRSERYSVLRRPFANKWLNLAIVWELVMLMAVINVPFLQDAFGTTSLALEDWALVGALAVLIIPVLEVAKWVIRRRGESDLVVQPVVER